MAVKQKWLTTINTWRDVIAPSVSHFQLGKIVDNRCLVSQKKSKNVNKNPNPVGFELSDQFFVQFDTFMQLM
ncbi:MAG: hypothetical protein ACI8WB_000823 [Phenylobacterium sp.]|jgi:hypothetical protein